MTRLKEIVLNADFKNMTGGYYQFHENFSARYIADLTGRPKLKRKLKGAGYLIYCKVRGRTFQHWMVRHWTEVG